MATRRPIRIEIPAELELSSDEIISLDNAFRAQLAVVESPTTLDPVPFPAINTTKLAVEIEVIRPRRTTKKSSKKTSKKTSKKSASKKR